MSDLSEHPILHHLAGQHWQRIGFHANAPFTEPPLLALNKLYPNGVDVIVSLHLVQDTYQIYSDAEHLTSGPNVVKQGECTTLNEALALLQATCQRWDQAAASASTAPIHK